jgi:hypothetical protein
MQVITFPPEGAFIVDSSIAAAGPQRTDFQFTSATLQLPKGRSLKLPPFGKGWCVCGAALSPFFAVGVKPACPGSSLPDLQPSQPALRTQLLRHLLPLLFSCARFETVYMDEDIRIAFDSRGDTLVVARNGPPRRFP